MPWVCGRFARRQIDSVCTDCRGGRGGHAALLPPSAGCRRHSSVPCSAAERGRRGGAAMPAGCCSAVQHRHCLCCRQTTKSGVSFWGLCPPGGGGAGGGGGVGATCSREGRSVSSTWSEGLRAAATCSSLLLNINRPTSPQHSMRACVFIFPLCFTPWRLIFSCQTWVGQSIDRFLLQSAPHLNYLRRRSCTPGV